MPAEGAEIDRRKQSELETGSLRFCCLCYLLKVDSPLRRQPLSCDQLHLFAKAISSPEWCKLGGCECPELLVHMATVKI